MTVTLRDVRREDLPVFYEHQRDEGAAALAGVASRDEPAFRAHWSENILGDPAVVRQTIVADGGVAGYVIGFDRDGRREVGYWLGRAWWGRGIASRAVARFLEIETARPLHAVVAGHNTASQQVLLKCGFVVDDEADVEPDADGSLPVVFVLPVRES